MGTRTGIIRFNVRERGRKHRGQDRNFDTAALAALINGGEVQERVKNRDLRGYYGHWPRVRFGMDPGEGAILDGRHVSIEPAIVTTSLKAHPDGTIEHEAEFLDTPSGRLAERLFKSRAGGFSSAIDIKPLGAKQLPVGFYGFDYVLEPNFTQNRGYALDSASDETLSLMDDVNAYTGLIDSTNKILDQLQADYDRMAQAFDAVLTENNDLMGQLAKMKAQAREKPKAAMDDCTSVVMGSRTSRFDGADSFKAAPLAGFEKPKEDEPVETAADRHLERRFGYGS